MKADHQIPNEKHILENLNNVASTLDRAYLGHLKDSWPLPYDEFYSQLQSIHDPDNIRALRISRWVYDKSEKIIDCFQNVLSVFADSDASLALVIHRTSADTEMYFVTQNTGAGRNEDSNNSIALLADSICGNFPGTEISEVASKETKTVLDRLFHFYDGKNNGYKAIAALSNVPSEKTEDYLSQGMDKLLNGIVPSVDRDGNENDYVIVILAKALDQDAVHAILSGYQELATSLMPYSGYQFQVGENEATSDSEMLSLSHTEGVSSSITKTHSVNVSGLVNASSAITKGVNIAVGLRNLCLPIFHLPADVSGGAHYDQTHGSGAGASAGYGYSVARTETVNTSDTRTTGTTHTVSLGTSESTTYTYKSYQVSDLIQKLEFTIDRIQKSQANGLWSSAAYVFARSTKQVKNIANFLRALSQGNESHVQHAYVQCWPWMGNSSTVTPFGEAAKYLRHFVHPIFIFGNSAEHAISVTPATDVSTSELSKIFAFPRNSVQGIPVIDCARFGREPHSMSKITETLDLGRTYHMWTEGSGRVLLDRAALTAHTFITGSTGAGKSNTICTMLDKICLDKEKKGSGPAVRFLVIEPAKGEYKEALGGCGDVSVYGTNPKKSKLLRLNPFSFPDDTHVLEHIDRLIEIFNACWPMYAAMPAVLKASIEQAYVNCGWSLYSSTCVKADEGDERFPTFADVMQALPAVVDRKGFSRDTQGDYKGALLTRLESLTNGINGQVLCSENELTNRELFDKNVIVDLSRVGSTETKALFMGILILKLQEYRMAQRAKGSSRANSGLRHITVLEEAHNLLRRTSSEQSQDSSNLQGKSVEMLTNAIAEMRTYGEGFVIADQAPGLLDKAVIRNTNTKIILRLPDEGDRMLVGKAAGLNDDQIQELSRLDVGVAAVFQNHWIEPVLCKIDGFPRNRYQYKPEAEEYPIICKEAEELFSGLLTPEQTRIKNEDVDAIKKWIDRHSDGGPLTQTLLRAVDKSRGVPSDEDRRHALYCLIKGQTLFAQAARIPDALEACRTVDQQIRDMFLVSQDTAEKIRSEAAYYTPELQRYREVR